MYLQNMIINHTKHVVKQFAYNLHVLGKMKGMSNEQMSEHFREAFSTK